MGGDEGRAGAGAEEESRVTQLALLELGEAVPRKRRETRCHRLPSPWQQLDFVWMARPRTWGECQRIGLGSQIPCPFATCRYSLLVDVNGHGTVRDMSADCEIGERATCALVVCGRGGVSGFDIAKWMGTTPERVWQIEGEAVAKVRRALDLPEAWRPSRWRGWERESPVVVDRAFDKALDRAVANPPTSSSSSPVRRLTREEIEREYAGGVRPLRRPDRA